jgi:uncharacterized repeat protein (TIGR03943 family)
MGMSAHVDVHGADTARAGRLRLSPARVSAGVALTAWAGLFWFLLVSGRTSLYLSSRTSWVVPVGAVLLTGAAIGRLASARVIDPKPLSRVHAWVLALMVVPVVVTLALPPGTLGSFAASRRGSFARTGFATSAEEISEGQLTLLDVAGAQTSKEGQRALAARAGEQVTFLGFVVREDGTPADEFLLTRFIVSCCISDATVAQLRVVNVPPGRFAEDDWIRVSGTIYPVGREVILDADPASIVPAIEPDPPYLTP